jgi:transcriptional regulator with XRE-family HTH domain
MRQRLGMEIRTARLMAGLSQREVGVAAGVSAALISRAERGLLKDVSVNLLATLFAVLGMRLSARPYPEGPPIRDVAHARLLARFQAQMGRPLRFRTEVPLRFANDLRAWDGEIVAPDGRCKLEAETVLHDLQAADRRVALKMADDHVERVILLIAATRRNRAVIGEFRVLIAARYPADTREVLRDIRAGRLPVRSGMALL